MWTAFSQPLEHVNPTEDYQLWELLPTEAGIQWRAFVELKTLHEYLYLKQLKSYKMSALVALESQVGMYQDLKAHFAAISP